MGIVTPESFLKEAREKIAFDSLLKEDTSTDKPLQTVIEKCMRAIDGFMFKANDSMTKIALEILEVNKGRPVSEQWLNETVDIEAEFKKLEKNIRNAEIYAERAGTVIENSSGKAIIFDKTQINSVCRSEDSYVYAANSSIGDFVEEGLWLKPANHPKYSTSEYREKYLHLIETVKKTYVFCEALLNKHYDSKKLPSEAMSIIPATKSACGNLLIEGAAGKTVTSPPFITESMFNTGK